MSRLDDHVGWVRVKLTLAAFVRALPWAVAVLAGVAFLVILVERFSVFKLPRQELWLWIGLGVAVVAPAVLAIIRRPTRRQAAVAIDQKLGLNEKFSTALYVRSSQDPFAAAVVRDAEQAAVSANLRKQFPITMPGRGLVALAAIAAVTLGAMQLKQRNLFAHTPPAVEKPPVVRPQLEDPKLALEKALAELERAPHEVAQTEQIKMAKQELRNLLNQEKIADPPAARARAAQALEEMEAAKQQVAESQKAVNATTEMNMLKSVDPLPPSETGPVADAQRALAKGNVDEAVKHLKDAVANFSQMDKKEQEKAAAQMENLAQQIARQASDPKAQEQIQKPIQTQLQKAGADPKQAEKQAKDMAQKIQQAAKSDQGSKGDQQGGKSDQGSKGEQQSAKSDQGSKSDQQSAKSDQGSKGDQQSAKSDQGGKSDQQTAKDLQNQVQQMATQAIQQANQHAGKSQDQQRADAKALDQAVQKAQQAANAQASAQQMAQTAQALAQSMKQAAGQGAPGQSNKPPEQSSQGQASQQQMQQQMAQLDAMAKSAEQTAGQQADAGKSGEGAKPGGGTPGISSGGTGQGGGANPAGSTGRDIPTTPELSLSPTNDKGRIIAGTFVKAPADIGKRQLKLLPQMIPGQTTDDGSNPVDNDPVPRADQSTVKGYFDGLKDEATKP